MALHDGFEKFEWPGRGPPKFNALLSWHCSLSTAVAFLVGSIGKRWFENGPRLLVSHGVHRDVDPEDRGGVAKHRADVVLEQVSDPVKLHHVSGLLAQPELVELDEEVAVEVVEVTQAWHDVAVGWRGRHVEDVRLGAAVVEKSIGHVRQIDADNRERISEMKPVMRQSEYQVLGQILSS